MVVLGLISTHTQAPDIPLLAAMLLMTMSLPLAFVALRNLLERGVLRAFYSGLTEESEAYFRVSSRPDIMVKY